MCVGGDGGRRMLRRPTSENKMVDRKDWVSAGPSPPLFQINQLLFLTGKRPPQTHLCSVYKRDSSLLDM